MATLDEADPFATIQPTIGFVCPLFTEFKAVKAILEVDYGRREIFRHEYLDYIYHYGRIASEDVVAIYFPEDDIGLLNASRYANCLLNDHPSLARPRSHCFLVGIAGGIWTSKTDVRLGDVVLATSVMEWTFGKHLEDGFKTTVHPTKLSTGVRYLTPEFMYDRNRLAQRITDRIASMRQKDLDDGWTHPGQDADRLFNPFYAHQSDASDCDECSSEKHQHRQSRQSSSPKVHRGLIASGSSVLRDASWRAKLQEQDVLAVEMEASAVLSVDPKFIVIRGICDYADSHKNKKWQKYAAASAAATTALLIDQILSSRSTLPTTQLPYSQASDITLESSASTSHQGNDEKVVFRGKELAVPHSSE